MSGSRQDRGREPEPVVLGPHRLGLLRVDREWGEESGPDDAWVCERPEHEGGDATAILDAAPDEREPDTEGADAYERRERLIRETVSPFWPLRPTVLDVDRRGAESAARAYNESQRQW